LNRRIIDGNDRKGVSAVSGSARSAGPGKVQGAGESYHYRTAGYNRYPQGYTPNRSNKPPLRKLNKRRKALYITVMIALFCVFVFAMYQVIHYLVKSHQAKLEEQMVQTLITQNELAAQQEAAETAAATPTEALPEPAQTPEQYPAATVIHTKIETKPEVLLKFEQALAINPDTVGQLQMGESINTYVVQRDNSYYLRRSFAGEYSFSGAVFLDVSCSIYPQSRMLILHGHNMHDGTAFGKLSRYDDINYLNEYPFIKFSTLYESARYVPFAVVYYSIDSKSDLYLDVYQVNLMTDQEFAQFVSKIQGMSEYHIPVNVAGTDKIIMVTTCATGDSNMRFAVFAVKSDTI